MVRTVEYFTPVNEDGEEARVRFVQDRGRVLMFTVQYEPWIEGAFRPVVRFDNAHEATHRDVLDWNEETVRKDWDWEGAALTPAAAMNRAIAELKQAWAAYKSDFLRRKE